MIPNAERLNQLLGHIEAIQKKIYSPKFLANVKDTVFGFEQGRMFQMDQEIQHLDTYEMNNREVLHLVVTKRWYDAIVHGDKREEYRNLTNYWIGRLAKNGDKITETPFKTRSIDLQGFSIEPKYEWKYVAFHLGYVKECVLFELKGIELKSPKKEWFPSETVENMGLNFDVWAEKHIFFAIKLGEKVGN